jgi:hypothetical protein
VTVAPADGSAAVAPLAGEIATAGPAGVGLALGLLPALLPGPVLAAGAATPVLPAEPPRSCVLLVHAAASRATMTVTATAAARSPPLAFAARSTRTRSTFSRLPSLPSGLGFPV